MENRVEKRTTWAGSAKTEAASRFGTADQISERFELGQPILVGHHSEKRARRDQERMHANMDAGVEALDRSKRHEGVARSLEIQLDRSVFSDDEDAPERLKARIAKNEREADLESKLNKLWRKGGAEAVVASGLVSEKTAARMADTMRLAPWLKSPFDTTNIRARIRADKKRLDELEHQAEMQRKTEAAGGILVTGLQLGYCSVRFEAKPERDVLQALREAGFSWNSGAWIGTEAKLPTCVTEMVEKAKEWQS